MGSLIRATNLWGYDELVRELAGNPLPLLSRFQIPAAENRPDTSLHSFQSYNALLEASATELDCVDFGIRLARWQGLEILGPIAVIARNADTVNEAWKGIARYLHLHCPALVLRQLPGTTSGLVSYDYRINEPSLTQKRQSYELSMANALKILQLLCGQQQPFSRVVFAHSPLAKLTEYRRAYGCEVEFGNSWCGFQITTDIADQHINSADQLTHELAANYLESQNAPGGTTLAGRVSELVCRLLPTGQCNADGIAKELSMNPRTLRRHLAKEGDRYDQILERERQTLAAHYLTETGLRLTQITGLLGYAEQSTFNRSCQRWFGIAPRKFRQLNGKESA